MINIKIGINSAIQVFPVGITPLTLIQQKLISYQNKPIAALFNQKLIELKQSLTENGYLEILDHKDSRVLEILNHSAAHLMAQAIKRIYPHALLTIGPTIKEGFYYDIDFGDTIVSEKDFIQIEKIMYQITEEKLDIERKEIDYNEAQKLFENNHYKKIILEKIKDDQISIYSQGEFYDLCRGIHLTNTNDIKNFKLLKISGAYFKDDMRQKSLTRIYGIAFFQKIDLKNYLNLLKERQSRDHKNINKEQNFFMLNSEIIGMGLPFWLPKGATIRRIIERYIIDKEIHHDYQHVYTPILANTKLYETSGHLELYKDDMFPIMFTKDEKLVLRPMNCPHHMMIFKQQLRSYKDLPIKIAELGMMHRYENSGAVAGLQRAREMTLNDAHIFVQENQIQKEIIKIINLIVEVYKDFNITEYFFNLSTRDLNNKKKYLRDDEIWNKSELTLKNILKDLNISFQEKIGDAAFYGPKIDVQVLNALGHEQTLSTIQLDFLLPKRFDLTYIGADNLKHHPILIHRAIISTMERFIAYLIEKNKGVFPLWLAPIQIVLIPINNSAHLEYTQKIKNILTKNNFRVKLNDTESSLGFKIRKAQKAKIPYQIVIGEQEIKNDLLTIRRYHNQQQEKMTLLKFIENIKKNIETKKQL
ncbi:threonine--tRNA ligase [Candidatus Phytoplasma phoenicium]|uniref:Threonine--tRNA ligase n=1 Tax=Candidatus Phytoplasma phoenicium TaxID=198422 RepID=A0A0L0MJU2_9MOLU|nr:threonine--tRNA ligase [Candidatus Phytoplasma phoenicium]KND62546.1 Threonyl-tRNA synthetase [Candidatus Phytoplasma phoenicium]